MDYTTAYRQRTSDSIGSYSAFLELNQSSSFDLLRTSIIHSIRSRDFENQGFLERRYDGSNANRRERYSNPKQTMVEVENIELTDNESDMSDLEQSNSMELKQNKQNNQKTQKYQDYFKTFNIKNALNINSDIDSNTKTSNSDLAKVSGNESQMVMVRELKERDKNGLRLARRKFSNTIFEDCSTYNITSPNVELDEENSVSFNDSAKQNESYQKNKTADDISQRSEMEAPVFPCSDVISARSPEEHTSLCDTFFPQVNDYDSHSAEPMFESGSSSLVEKNNSINDEANCDASEDEKKTMPNKRKHSKRHRKRSRKKSKAKKPFIYECSKCGASYVIPTKGMNKVACCLHCDLWIPVEPVFVKRDKTTWNTCQIC